MLRIDKLFSEIGNSAGKIEGGADFCQIFTKLCKTFEAWRPNISNICAADWKYWRKLLVAHIGAAFQFWSRASSFDHFAFDQLHHLVNFLSFLLHLLLLLMMFGCSHQSDDQLVLTVQTTWLFTTTAPHTITEQVLFNIITIIIWFMWHVNQNVFDTLPMKWIALY